MCGHVLVATAEAGVGAPLVAVLERELGVSGVRLTANAVDFPLGSVRPDLSALRARDNVDFNIVPLAGRAKRLFIADMDSTMIGVECIDELADFAGAKAEVAAVTERAMRGEMDFETAIRERVARLEGVPLGDLDHCFSERVKLNPGARELVRTLGEAGVYTALVSGGFTYFTARVAEAAGFDEHRANVLEDDGSALTGRVVPPILGQQAKADRMSALCRELGTSASAVVAIGDGANDLAMISKAGLGIAYKAKPALRAGADAILDHSDLTAVLALVGQMPVKA